MTTNPAGPRLLGPAEVRRWPPSSTCDPPSSAARTSSSTPTPCAGSSASPASPATTWSSRSGPGSGRSRSRCSRSPAGSSRSRSTRCWPSGCPPRSRRTPRGRPTASRWCWPTRCAWTSVPGPPPTALVANLPYNVSVPVLIHLLTLLPSLERGLVMVQAEVADRLAAPPGSKTYGVPSVKAAWFADVRRAGAIGRNVFWPAPNVDSGLVAWTRREPPDTTATRAAGLRRRRRRLRPAPQAGARRPARAGRIGRDGDRRARGRGRRPDGARRGARRARLLAHRRGLRRPRAPRRRTRSP